ncbi:MAG: SxtJ family membrane protein [Gammaproteobacteria bacterium]|nr:SxtJ family membrane protein [Gammaproteobacteria bacterium]
MSTSHKIPELDRKGLREFGVVTGAIVGVLFGLFFPWLLERPIPRWPWVIFGVLALAGLAAPMALRPVYQAWMKFGLLMSRITTPLIMGIVFYLVITPMGLVMRLLGKDYMARRLRGQATSYRIESQATPPKRLEKPF